MAKYEKNSPGEDFQLRVYGTTRDTAEDIQPYTPLPWYTAMSHWVEYSFLGTSQGDTMQGTSKHDSQWSAPSCMPVQKRSESSERG